MDWTPGGLSRDVEDRRGSSGGGFGGGGLGIVGILFLLIISLITGRNYIGSYLTGGAHVATPNSRPANSSLAEDKSAQLVSFVLDDVQKEWETLLPQQTGQPYRHAKLVLFRDYTRSGCGTAQSQTGPFYCPQDEKVYIDLGFWDDLRRLGGSTADFAQAYVIAHELGHHVQNILGIEQQMRQLQGQNPGARNQLSVRLELQADCLAGVWAHTAAQRKIIDEADVNDGLNAAAAVGDDHIQKMSRGAVSPESFTHGSSAQRQSWFVRGLQSGNVNSCNTFQQGGGSNGSF
ncbi:KPN_02809 family neutral zinc metallopeptidase [Edaphobacter albus]|uniref:KPN_02809 family neutral zinc metallopeptidase n=1 Tax=Edaphobacter sp. 4G125 TaxID=2763071 RepID=UPI001649087B|nr:neutral zinc metallopeptidase [Edaphobacter sp. 4G125]QNI35700.1 neutral zinc metallopeptidase [Edaphobacter sp. 4G125]